MTSLDNLIESINTAVASGIKDTKSYEGIVFETQQGDKKINVNKKGNAVVFDDKSKVNFYHKLVPNTETFTKIQGRGKEYVYNIRSTIDLVVFTSNLNFKEYLISKLSTQKNVEIISIDNDAYRILKNEVGITEFDFKKQIFVVRYQALYKSEPCIEYCVN